MNKHKYIGRILEDFGDNDPIFGPYHGTTKIKDIVFEENGPDSMWFAVEGEDFGCGFDIHHGGIDCSAIEDGWLTFCGYGGHKWRIQTPERNGK